MLQNKLLTGKLIVANKDIVRYLVEKGNWDFIINKDVFFVLGVRHFFGTHTFNIKLQLLYIKKNTNINYTCTIKTFRENFEIL